MIDGKFSLKKISKRGKLPLKEAVRNYGVSFVQSYVNGRYDKMMKNQRINECKEMMSI